MFENYVEMVQVDDQQVELSLWDTAGEQAGPINTVSEYRKLALILWQGKRSLTDYARYRTPIRT